jgi:sulfonate transport system substrate-binding protein
MNKRKSPMPVRLLLSVLLLLAIAGCGKNDTVSAPGGGDNGDDKELFTIRVATQTGFNETQIAEELGYFKEQGIRIEYTGVLGKGVTEFQTILQGINDAFIGGHPPNVAQARLAGMKVLAVAPGMVDNKDFPHVRYLVQENSPIQSLSDINGKKVAITGVSACTDGYLKYYLKGKQLPEKVNWVTLPTAGQQEQSLTQGLVDVTTSHPPYAGIAVNQGGVRQIGTSWDILQSPGAGLSVRGFSEKFIKEHPDIVRGFTIALYKSHIWINAHQKEAQEIIARKLNLKAEDVSAFWYDEHKTIQPEYIEKWYEIAEDIGLWKKGDITPEEIYTNEFAPK